jgi:hypothetical protein
MPNNILEDFPYYCDFVFFNLGKLQTHNCPTLNFAMVNHSIGKVLVNCGQNDVHKTTVSVYSLRAKNRPAASMPVRGDEVEATLKTRATNPLSFDSKQAISAFLSMATCSHRFSA